AELAGLLADETRATFCLALLDGRAWTAGELARHARVAPSTATEHLHRLIKGGFLVEDRQGRHRYVRLAGPSVAALVEDLSSHLTPDPPARTLRAATVASAMARARTCYDHFAGRLGVAIADAMTGAGLLDQDSGIALTAGGHGSPTSSGPTRRGRAGGRSLAAAWTGPSAASTWPVRPAPKSAGTRRTTVGSARSAPAAPCRSPRTGRLPSSSTLTWSGSADSGKGLCVNKVGYCCGTPFTGVAESPGGCRVCRHRRCSLRTCAHLRPGQHQPRRDQRHRAHAGRPALRRPAPGRRGHLGRPRLGPATPSLTRIERFVTRRPVLGEGGPL